MKFSDRLPARSSLTALAKGDQRGWALQRVGQNQDFRFFNEPFGLISKSVTSSRLVWIDSLQAAIRSRFLKTGKLLIWAVFLFNPDLFSQKLMENQTESREEWMRQPEERLDLFKQKKSCDEL